MASKSLKMNAILNGIKTIIAIIFPIITFPYSSRVLQVENLGKVNFSGSIIGYFSLISALGISTYAIREGAGIRDSKKEFNLFVNQIFTINIISTIISYVLLLFVILLVPKLESYKLLLIIQSASLIFTTLGINWMNSIYEDYFYITVRSLMVQFISLLLLFLFVKTTEDYHIYALVTIISGIGGNIFNFFYSRKYCRIKLTRKLNIKKHIRPILVIFSIDIAASIYLNSDMTMLGIMVSNYSVGLYSVSVKLYSIIKTLLSSVIIVSLPRLCLYLTNKQKVEYNKTLTKIFNCLLMLVLPITAGINLLSNDIISIISGSNYIEANISLRILSIALIFSTFGSFINYTILIPMKKEKYVLQATVIASVVNISLNFVFIPTLQQNGAAISTAISEFLVLVIVYFYARKDIRINGIAKNLITSIAGCVSIILVAFILKYLYISGVLYTIITFFCSIISYGTVILLLKNEIAWEFANECLARMKR